MHCTIEERLQAVFFFFMIHVVCVCHVINLPTVEKTILYIIL